MTICSHFKNKINHGSSGKVKVLLKDLCLDLILPSNFKLRYFNVFYEYSLFLFKGKSIVSYFLIIKFNAKYRYRFIYN